MPGAPWSDAERWWVVRAGDLYDRRWVLVALCEDIGSRTVEQLQQQYARRSAEKWAAPKGTERIPLRIETEPEAVALEIRDYMADNPYSRASFPEVLQGMIPTEENTGPGWDVIDRGLRDYSFMNGTYLFAINDQLLTVEHERWKRICYEYSNHGGNLTAPEIARRFGIPTQVLRIALRKYGQFKASPPLPREDIEDHKDNMLPLIAEVIENKEARFLALLDREEIQRERAELTRLRKEVHSQERVFTIARDLAGAFPPPPEITVITKKRTSERWVGHAPKADQHLGKRVWSKESFGEDFDTDIGCQREINHAKVGVEDWIGSEPGRCSVLHLSNLGDLWHTLKGKTDHDTPLDLDTRAAKVLDMGAEAIRQAVLIWLTAVDLIFIRSSRGNHDGVETYWFMFLLEQMFKGDKRVHVHKSPGYYEAFLVEQTLHCQDHGWKAGSIAGWKTKAQAEVVARKASGDDFHQARWIYSYYGHLHEWEGGSLGDHHTLVRLPSMGESDDYETSLRYASQPGAWAYRLDPLGRIKRPYVFFREELDTGKVRKVAA